MYSHRELAHVGGPQVTNVRCPELPSVSAMFATTGSASMPTGLVSRACILGRVIGCGSGSK